MTNTIPSVAAMSAAVEKLRGYHFDFPRDREVREGLLMLAEQMIVRVNHLAPVGPGNRDEQDVLIVTGETGSGKSYTVNRALAELENPLDPSVKLSERTVSVKLPSPYSSKELARRILTRLDIPSSATSDLSDSELWGMVIYHCEKRGILVIHLDEFQRWKTERGLGGAGERQRSVYRLAESLNDILVNDRWPMSLAISGLPEIIEFWSLEPMEQIARRTKIVRFAQIEDRYASAMDKAIQEYADLAEISVNFVFEDIAERLIFAARNTVGIALEMAQEAVLAALRRGSAAVEDQDFAKVYARRNDGLGAANPFLDIEFKHLVHPDKKLFSELEDQFKKRAVPEPDTDAA